MSDKLALVSEVYRQTVEKYPFTNLAHDARFQNLDPRLGGNCFFLCSKFRRAMEAVGIPSVSIFSKETNMFGLHHEMVVLTVDGKEYIMDPFMSIPVPVRLDEIQRRPEVLEVSYSTLPNAYQTKFTGHEELIHSDTLTRGHSYSVGGTIMSRKLTEYPGQSKFSTTPLGYGCIKIIWDMSGLIHNQLSIKFRPNPNADSFTLNGIPVKRSAKKDFREALSFMATKLRMRVRDMNLIMDEARPVLTIHPQNGS